MGGGSIMWSALLEGKARLSNVACKYFGTYFCGAGDASLFEDKKAGLWSAWLDGRDFEGFWFFCSEFRRHGMHGLFGRNQ